MKTFFTVLLLSLLAMGVSSCSHGYTTYSGAYGYTRDYERTPYPAVYIGTPSAGYSRPYRGSNHYYSGCGTGWR